MLSVAKHLDAQPPSPYGILDLEIVEGDAVADVDHGALGTAFRKERRAHRFRAFLTELLGTRREGGSIGND